MPILTELPREIIFYILDSVDAEDLLRVAGACRTLYHAVRGNVPLYKQHYLKLLDAPPNSDGVEWERLVTDVLRLQSIGRRVMVNAKKDDLGFVHKVMTELLKNAVTNGVRPNVSGDLAARLPYSRNAELLAAIFEQETNRAAFLCRSFIYERARAEFLSTDIGYWHGPPKPEHQLSAHLHCLYGVPQLLAYPVDRRRARMTATRAGKQQLMRPFACSKVYDLRQYTRKTQWGPFMDDGSMRVDWEKVEAVMIVLGANIDDLGLTNVPMFDTFSCIPFAGTWPNSWKSPQKRTRPRVLDPLEHLDPYGVTGVWLRVICFLDYSDFFAYNFAADAQPPPHVPRPAIQAGEATRLILMRIYVTGVEQPGPEDGQRLPVVHFKGISRSLDHSFDENADSDIRGTVRLTPQGEVRWTSFSILGGVERWRSESIQVGGVGSAKGVFGHWFDKDFDPRGPAGPSAFWKISDKNESSANSGEPEGELNDIYADVLDDYGFDPEEEEEEGEEGEEEEEEDEEMEDEEQLPMPPGA
ncbi:hypothetical protein GGS20DRAFT_553754 [Poronia punctata]|nr:hypothetical protein GGS20DRAFT_553754 [Poronia punctata]